MNVKQKYKVNVDRSTSYFHIRGVFSDNGGLSQSHHAASCLSLFCSQKFSFMGRFALIAHRAVS